MKQYERFLVYGLLLILLILVGWFIDNKTKTERYQCWPCSSGETVGAFILDTKTGHLYRVTGRVIGNVIHDLGAIEISKPVFDLQPLKEVETKQLKLNLEKGGLVDWNDIEREMNRKPGYNSNE